MAMAKLSPLESERAHAALLRAIDEVGSQSATGRLLGVTQGAVNKWVTRKQLLPADHVLAVEAAAGVSKHDLRPDIYPRELASPAPLAELPDADMAAAR